MQGKLTVKNNNDKETVITFKPNDKITIGRNKRCHLIVKDSKISSMHCQIDIGTDSCRLIDLGSTNGSYVNSKKVSSLELNSGDIIKLGNIEIIIEYTTLKTQEKQKSAPTFEITETWSESELPVEEVQYVQDYKILKKIADFGNGENYQAEHKTRNNIVALRKLPVNSSAEAFQKFKEKISFSKQLDSARLLKIFDVISENDVPIYITEYIQGSTLDEWIVKRQKISLSRSLKIAAYIASGLEYLHRIDVKDIGLCPQHIIIEELTKRTKIFDVATLRLLESCGYSISNFYARGKDFDAINLKGEQADIYAFGCILFLLLTGDKYSPDEKNPGQILEKKRMLPDQIIELVCTCLLKPQDKGIKDHYQTITSIFNNIKKK